MYLLFDGYKDRNILRKVLFLMYPLLYYLFHFAFPCGFCTSFSLNVLCFQRKVLILQHKNKIEKYDRQTDHSPNHGRHQHR